MTGLPDELVAAITRSGQAPLVFRVKQGDANAVAESLRLVQDTNAKTDERLVLVRAFGEVREPGAVPALLTIASSSAPEALPKAALASLATYNDESIGENVVELLPKLTGDVQTAAFTLLASRVTWSMRLLDAVQSGRVKRATVPEALSDHLRASKDKQVSELAARVMPRPATMPA